VRLRGEDPVETLLDFARTHRVGSLLVGRANLSGWRWWFGRTVLQRLLKDAKDVDLHVIAFEREAGSP